MVSEREKREGKREGEETLERKNRGSYPTETNTAFSLSSRFLF